MESAPSKPASAPKIGRVRALLYAIGVGVRTLVAVFVVAVLGAPIILVMSDFSSRADSAGVFVAAGLALLGVGIPLIALVMSSADWAGAASLLGYAAANRPQTQLRRPRTLVRPLAYAVIMLSFGGAVSVLGVLLIVGFGVALISPFLTAVGDRAVIGPVTLTTLPQSIGSAVVAVIVLAGLFVLAPLGARAHAALVVQMLTSPEQRLEHDLTRTTQSRTRLVRTFDVERRRIERDLHDGVQPQIMSVSMTLGLALAEMSDDAPGRKDVIRAQQQTRRALEAMRQFVHNIHPQVLVDHGLAAALRELSDGLTLPVTVRDDLPGRLRNEIETNLYFCIAELLGNVVKHSGATSATVSLHRLQHDLVQVDVHDDGHGGAHSGLPEPGGLDGIIDRLAAFDGELAIDSPIGGPTDITMTVYDIDIRASHANT